MTLRLALQINGDARGASIALDTTVAGLKTTTMAADAAGAALNRQVTNASAAGAAIKGTGLQTANLAAQLQDVAVQLASGQSPFQIALQQGTQINQVIGQQGVRGAVASLGTAFASLVSPVSLATIGIIGFGGLALQGIEKLTPATRTAADELADFSQQMKSAVAGYTDAGKVASDVINGLGRRPIGAISSDLQKQFEDQKKEVVAFIDQARQLGPVLAGSLAPVDQKMGALLMDFGAGRIDAAALVASLTVLGNSDLGPLGFMIKSTAINPLVEAAQKASDLQDKLVGISHVLATAATDNKLQFLLAQGAEGARSKSQYQIDLDAITALSPAQQADIARRQKTFDLADAVMTADRKEQEIAQAGTLAYAQAAIAISVADRTRLLDAQASIDAGKTQLATIGSSIAETQRLTFVQQQLASAEQAAAQSGVSVSQAYIDKIKALGAAYGDLQQAIAAAGALNDLAFQRSQIGLSPDLADGRQQARAIYGDDLASGQAQFLIQQVRINDLLGDAYKQGEQFAEGLATDFQQAVAGAKSWGDVLVDALDNIESKALQMGADGIWDMIWGGGNQSGTSGGGLGSWRSSVLSGAFGGAGGGTGETFSSALQWAGLAKAGGGMVNGPGTATSDSIPARLSNGEFVVRAAAVRRNRPLLEAINSGVGFAQGGFVGGLGSSIGSGGTALPGIAPVMNFSTQIDARGSDMAQFQAALDARDREWMQQLKRVFPSMHNFMMEHPHRGQIS